MITRQAIENGHIPFDQVVGFLDDGQFLHSTENAGYLSYRIEGQNLKKFLSAPRKDKECKENSVEG
jgi:hypothetical protein